MFKVLCLAIVCLVHSSLSDNAALEIRVTEQGFDYGAQLAMKILQVELPKLKIPDIQTGDITASNFTVTKFSPPSATISLQGPTTFSVSLKGATIGLTAKVKACQKILGESICASVDAQMEASNVDLQLTAQLVLSQDMERPSISSPVCQTTIGKLELKTSGGPLGWILNLFHSILAKVVKPDIEKAVNEQVADAITLKLDPELANMKIDIDIGKSYDLDYELVSAPVITSQHAELDLKGKVSCLSNPSLVSPYPSTPLVTQAQSDAKMAYILVSDKIANDFLFFAHNLNQTAYLATKDTPQIGEMLYLHCSTICLGSMIPNVDQLYPNTEAAVAYVSTTDAPTIVLHADGTATIQADVTIHVYAPNVTSNSSILLSKTTSTSSLFVDVVDNTITGNVNVTDMTMTILESQMDPEIMQYVLDHIDDFIKPYVQKMINQFLQKGVKIPTIGQGKGALVNPQLRFLERTLQVETDVVYNI